MRNLALAVVVAVLGLAAPAFAWDSSSGQTVPVGMIEIWGNGHVVLMQAAAVCNASTYNTQAQIVVGQQSVTADGLKEMLSTLTAAKLAGRNVQIFATSVSGVCYVGAIHLVD